MHIDQDLMILQAPSTGLQLDLTQGVSGEVRVWLAHEFDSIAAQLRPWGRWTTPVRVEVVGDQQSLRAAATCETRLQLTGIAGLNQVTILSPQRWPVPPTSAQLLQAMVHELAHVLLFQRCCPSGQVLPPYIATWFREGMAVVVAEGAPSPNLRRDLGFHPHLDHLPNADDARMADDAAACYLAAALLFQAWMDRFGAVGLTSLCRAMRAGHPFAEAHLRACDLTEAAFVSNWVAAVRAEAKLQ